MTDERIALPENFPVAWESEEEAGYTWERDTHHRPDPITPLEADFWQQAGLGWQDTLRILDLEPVYQMCDRCFNGYLYSSRRTLLDDDAKKTAKKTNEAAQEKAMAEMGRRWQEQWQPEILGHLAFWDEFDLDSAAPEDLAAHLADTWERLPRLWAIHFAIVRPAYDAMGKLAEYYEELFADYDEKTDPFAAQRLFQAMPNLTVAMGHALWDLSRRAMDQPALADQLRAPGCTLDALRAADHADFAAALNLFLDQHGQRPPTWTIAHPTWREDPAPIFRNLRDYLQPDARDPRVEMTRLAAERDEAIAATRAKLTHFPQPVRDRFEQLLQWAQTGMILSEDHGVYIDFASTARIRYVLMACGHRLASADAIDAAEDALFLHCEEIHSALAAPPAADLRPLVAKRRAAFQHFSAITPPDRLGVEPPPRKDGAEKERLPEEPGVLHGNPCAAGIARGPVRVLRAMTDTDAIQPSDIMVAVTTNPAWTPLFATIAALVTQTGGKLSHGAVVAREYGIPAVLGVKDAVDQLKDGQQVEVDGSAGTIRLLD